MHQCAKEWTALAVTPKGVGPPVGGADPSLRVVASQTFAYETKRGVWPKEPFEFSMHQQN